MIRMAAVNKGGKQEVPHFWFKQLVDDRSLVEMGEKLI